MIMNKLYCAEKRGMPVKIFVISKTGAEAPFEGERRGL